MFNLDYEGELTNNDNESGDNFPSLEKLYRAALRPKVSMKASKIGLILQRLE